jgi:hypothetical protein
MADRMENGLEQKMSTVGGSFHTFRSGHNNSVVDSAALIVIMFAGGCDRALLLR